VLKQFDILEENVTRMSYAQSFRELYLNCPIVIESISSSRDPQPDFEAVYLLMPTSQNVERIIDDFSGRRQYAAAHLFFLDGGHTALETTGTTSSLTCRPL
jgi:syntaxin-binding protein 1